jgi:hypothetical protein
LGVEPLGMREAFAAEAERLKGEEDRLLTEPDYYSHAHQHWSYFARGCYAEQIKRWYAVFPRENFLFLRSEDLFRNPADVMRKTFAFLDLSEFTDLRFNKKDVNGFICQATPSLTR